MCNVSVMVLGPSPRMRALAARWLTDRVTLSVVTFPADTRPLGKATTVTTGLPLYTDQLEPLTTDEGVVLYADDPTEIAALVRVEVVNLQDDTSMRRSVRELTVWVEDTYDAAAGQRLTVTFCGDPTLVGKFGEVITVERDSLRAVRRLNVRMANDA